MIELSKQEYLTSSSLSGKLHELALRIPCETTYPASILDGTQTGRIFVDDRIDPQAAIFWHYCGISYVCGNSSSDEFIKGLSALLNKEYEPEQRNFYLIVSDQEDYWIPILDQICSHFTDIQKKQRYTFSFVQQRYESMDYRLPAGYEYFVITPEYIPDITGRVIPGYSWESLSDYFKLGKGFGIYDVEHSKIVSTAFSSGISSSKIDIGIETQPQYRKQGFAVGVAAKMIDYILSVNKIPDWGCDAQNAGSAATAQHVGFVHDHTYTIYTR